MIGYTVMFQVIVMPSLSQKTVIMQSLV